MTLTASNLLNQVVCRLLEFYKEKGIKKSTSVAFRNRLLEPFCEGLLASNASERDRKIVEEKLTERRKLFRRQLDVIKSFEDKGIPYVLIKTLRPYFHVSEDIDILAPSFGDVKDHLIKMGFKFKPKPKPEEVTFRKAPLNVEVYRDLSWFICEAIPSSSVKVIRTKGASEFDVNVPSPEDHMLIISSHSVFHNELALGDLIWFEELAERANFRSLIKGAEESGLLKCLQLFLNMVNLVKARLLSMTKNHERGASLSSHVYPLMTMLERRCEFIENYPMSYPLTSLLEAYTEKIRFNLENGLEISMVRMPKFFLKRFLSAIGDFSYIIRR